MATPTADSFSVASGATVSAGRGAVVPAWLRGAAVNQWVEITGTSGAAGAAIDPWGGLALVTGTGVATLVSSANGGHGDSSDNRVASIDLMADAPSWTVQIAASSSVTANATHNADGKPGSRHVRYEIHYISQRDRVMLFGANGRYIDGGDNYKVDGHTISGTWAWDAADTWATLSSGQGFGRAHDPSTGNVITNGGRIWSQATNTWSAVTGFAGGWRYPVCCAPQRSEFFALQWGDGGPDSGSSGTTAIKFGLDGTSGSTITFNSSSAYTQWQSDSPRYAGMDYDQDNDCYLFYAGQTFSGGTPSSNVTQRVYKITPNAGTTWDMSILTVTGATPNAAPSGGAGINKRWLYVPALKGFVVAPQSSSNLFFLRTA